MTQGVWFGVEHRCKDGTTENLHWRRVDGKEVHPRRWLDCDKCGYAVQLVTSHPKRKDVA
jgi:hypothetical protein